VIKENCFNNKSKQTQNEPRKLIAQLRKMSVKPAPQKKATKTKKPLYKVSSSVRMGSADDDKFTAALTDPFSTKALGARICDSFAFPTATYHLHGSISLVSPNAVTTGSVFLSPHPILSYADLSGGVWNSSAFTAVSSMAGFTANTALAGATYPMALAAVLSTYRVVSVGYKIRVQIPELVRTGRLYYAPIPLARDLPAYQLLINSVMLPGAVAGSRILGGINIAAALTGVILSLPGAKEISMNDLSTKDLMLVCKPNAPAYQTFHTSLTGSGYNAAYNSGDNGGSGAVTGSVAYPDVGDLIDPSGMTGFILHWEGMPVAAHPLIDIEYIYHLEGMPAVITGASAGSTPVPSGSLLTHVNPQLFEKALALAARMPWGAMVSAGLGNLGVIGRGAV